MWAIRHPASGYVQGINDLVTPFFQVFLSLYIGESCESVRRPDKTETSTDPLNPWTQIPTLKNSIRPCCLHAR